MFGCALMSLPNRQGTLSDGTIRRYVASLRLLFRGLPLEKYDDKVPAATTKVKLRTFLQKSKNDLLTAQDSLSTTTAARAHRALKHLMAFAGIEQEQGQDLSSSSQQHQAQKKTSGQKSHGQHNNTEQIHHYPSSDIDMQETTGTPAFLEPDEGGPGAVGTLDDMFDAVREMVDAVRELREENR